MSYLSLIVATLNTMKKSTNKKPNRRRARKGARFAVSQMQGAPAGVSQDLQQFTKFLPGKSPEGIRIHTCVPLAQVQRTSTGADGSGLVPANPSGSVTEAMSVQLSLTSPQWLGDLTTFGADYTSPVFDLIASAFVRYKVTKLVFHYEPQASATTDERLVFAFAADPKHPILVSFLTTQSGLLSVADSVAFAPWRAWSMDVSYRLNDQLLYTYEGSGTNPRLSDFGGMALLTSSVSQPAGLICGVLYAEMIVELDEFCPISVTRPSAFLRLIPKMESQLSRHGGPTSVGSGKASSNEDDPKKKFSSYERYLLDKQV